MSKVETVKEYISAINEKNVDRLIEMMSEDHLFIDAYGQSETKEMMKSGWVGYFLWFPDYHIEVEEIIEGAKSIGIFGYASGSYLEQENKYWRIPASWRAVVQGDQLEIWQVYADSKHQLDSMK